MLMPIMAITAALVGGWAIALLIEVYVHSSRTVESESSKRSSNGIRRKLSLWSFVLLLFAPLLSLRLTRSRQASDLALTEQSRESDDETFCSLIS